jgi:hypothetical protein
VFEKIIFQSKILFRYKIFQVSRGQLRFPWSEEQISHENLPFQTSEHLKLYQQAIDLQTEYYHLEESKNTDDLIQFYETHNKQWRAMIDTSTERYI